MLIAAIGCNIAWGIVDAVMFILTNLAEKGHGKSILMFVKKTKQSEKARQLIADALPPVVASVLETQQLEDIRKALYKIAEPGLKIRITMKEMKMAIAIFLLVFLSTIPVALPFAFINDVKSGNRTFNNGVWQGSCLASTLFNIYINDITEISQENINIYADDIKKILIK